MHEDNIIYAQIGMGIGLIQFFTWIFLWGTNSKIYKYFTSKVFEGAPHASENFWLVIAISSGGGVLVWPLMLFAYLIIFCSWLKSKKEAIAPVTERYHSILRKAYYLPKELKYALIKETKKYYALYKSEPNANIQKEYLDCLVEIDTNLLSKIKLENSVIIQTLQKINTMY